MQLIKGESSFWINKQQLTKQKFEWQDEYFAVSVSESMIEKVRDYIRNQEEHHKQIQFQQEYDEFISKYEFPKLNDENNNLAKAKIDFKYIYPPAKAGGNSMQIKMQFKMQINPHN